MYNVFGGVPWIVEHLGSAHTEAESGPGSKRSPPSAKGFWSWSPWNQRLDWPGRHHGGDQALGPTLRAPVRRLYHL